MKWLDPSVTHWDDKRGRWMTREGAGMTRGGIGMTKKGGYWDGKKGAAG
ncbi:hypothetical protein [Wolbachia endosymbiont (group A) of Andrena trimmerana]